MISGSIARQQRDIDSHPTVTLIPSAQLPVCLVCRHLAVESLFPRHCSVFPTGIPSEIVAVHTVTPGERHARYLACFEPVNACGAAYADEFLHTRPVKAPEIPERSIGRSGVHS